MITPCPNCGSLPTIELSAVADGTHVCTHDCPEEPAFYIELSKNFESPQAAEEAWNLLIASLTNKTPR